MAFKIAAGGSGPAEIKQTAGISEAISVQWRVFSGSINGSNTTLATSATPNGFAVTADGVVSVPVGTAPGLLKVDVFSEDDYGDLPRQYSRYEFEVVCLTVTLDKKLQTSVDGVWTVKIRAIPVGGIGPFGFTWQVQNVPIVAGGGTADDFVTIKLSADSEVSVRVNSSNGCVSSLESTLVPVGSMEPLRPSWWPVGWAWPPAQTPPADFPTCRPKSWPSTEPPWLSALYNWPWPSTPCFDAANYCVKQSLTPSQVIQRLNNAGLSGVTFSNGYFHIPPNGRTLSQVRQLIENAGISFEDLGIA